jgi:hypothetical protein
VTDNLRGDAMSSPRVWTGVLLGALLAADGAWLVGESQVLNVTPAKVHYNMMGRDVIGETQETLQAAANKTASRVYGVYGALLGLALGVAGGLAAGRPGSAGVGAGVGLIAGAAAGTVAPLVVLPLYGRLAGDSVGELVAALLMHCGLWAPIGAAAGLALGVGLGERSRCLRAALGGALGVVVGVGVFELLGALAFPLAKTCDPIAALALPRLLMFLLTALPAAACAVVVAGRAVPGKKGPEING